MYLDDDHSKYISERSYVLRTVKRRLLVFARQITSIWIKSVSNGWESVYYLKL